MNKKVYRFLSVMCCVLLLGGCSVQADENNKDIYSDIAQDSASADGIITTETRDLFAMDTIMTIKATGVDAKGAVDEAVAEIKRLDDLLSVGNSKSEISIINKNRNGYLSEDVLYLTKRSLDLYESQKGAYEITVYPLMELWGDYNAEELNKKTKALLSIEKIIVETYAEKTGMAPEELTRLMYAETWYTAEEAVAAGFVDELLPLTATVTADNDDVTINDMTVSVKRFANKQALLKMKAGGKGMDNQTLLSKLKAFFGREKSQAEVELESEVLRLRGEIERLRSEVKTADQIYALIEDNIKSGGVSVRGSTLEMSNAADDAISKVVRFANGRM